MYTFIHGEPMATRRYEFWDKFCFMTYNIHLPWVCVESWNCMWNISDKMGGRYLNPHALEVNRCNLDKCNLLDLCYRGL